MNQEKLLQIVRDSMVTAYAGSRAATFDPITHILGPSPRQEIWPHVVRMIKKDLGPAVDIEMPEFEQDPTIHEYVVELDKRIAKQEGREGREVRLK